MNAPLVVRWTGDSFEPLPHFRKRCDQALVIGEVYRMTAQEDRSDISHKHEFAWLKEAWKTLPDAVAELYPSPEHLRKRALITAGYYTEEVIDAGSNAAALRVAAYVRGHDEFALVIVRGPFVFVRHAKSQSYRAMGRKEFQQSKTAIMEVVSQLLGVSTDDLQKAEAA
jgi:hypothetical protein